MKRHSFFTVFLFLLCTLCLLVSCMDAEKSYRSGDFEGAVKALEWKKDLSIDEFILKADSLAALGRYDEALKNYMLFLLLSDSYDPRHQYAVDCFVKLNDYDTLALLVLDKSDGFEARKALYRAYAGIGDTDNALNVIGLLSNEMTYPQLLAFVLERPVAGAAIARLFSSWWLELGVEDKASFLDLLCRYSELDGFLDEEATKICLGTTDSMIGDSYYTQDDILLSKLLKTKGNILEKLYDRINARIYWNQAYKLNPDDSSLLEKL